MQEEKTSEYTEEKIIKGKKWGHDCTFSSDTIIVNSPQLWTAFSWVWRPSLLYRAPHKTNSSDGATDEHSGDLNKHRRH